MQLVRCTVDIGDLAQGYTKGGQYLQIRVGREQASLLRHSICRPHRKAEIELLVKNQGETAQILCDSKAGMETAAFHLHCTPTSMLQEQSLPMSRADGLQGCRVS